MQNMLAAWIECLKILELTNFNHFFGIQKLIIFILIFDPLSSYEIGTLSILYTAGYIFECEWEKRSSWLPSKFKVYDQDTLI